MLLGSPTAGTSSVTKSLIEGKAVVVFHIDDHTQVADIQTWVITPQNCIQLFDFGGV